MNDMKVGIFDSGIGGLIVARAIRKAIPAYDYVYFGDTKRVPYGSRSHEVVFKFTRECVDYLLRDENCAIVIIACNTSSARALRKIQEEYLPRNFPDRKVLGVLIPAAEEGAKTDRIGVMATEGTVASGTFVREIKKLNKRAKVFQNPAPLLVPLAEAGEKTGLRDLLKKYLAPLLKEKIKTLVLGCTHYPIFKKEIKKAAGKEVKLISQDEIIPKKLKEYLKKHKEIDQKLSRKGTAKILVTDITPNILKLSKKWFGEAKPELVKMKG